MRFPSDLEIAVGLLALVLSTIAFLVNAYAIALIALVLGAVSFGILIGRFRSPEHRPQRHLATVSERAERSAPARMKDSLLDLGESREA